MRRGRYEILDKTVYLRLKYAEHTYVTLGSGRGRNMHFKLLCSAFHLSTATSDTRKAVCRLPCRPSPQVLLTLSRDLNLDWGRRDQTEAPSASNSAFRKPAPTSLQTSGLYRGAGVAFLSGLANPCPFPPLAGGMWLQFA